MRCLAKGPEHCKRSINASAVPSPILFFLKASNSVPSGSPLVPSWCQDALPATPFPCLLTGQVLPPSALLPPLGAAPCPPGQPGQQGRHPGSCPMDRAPQRHHRASQGKRPCGPAGRWKGQPGSSEERARWDWSGSEEGEVCKRGEERDGLAGARLETQGETGGGAGDMTEEEK